MKDYSKSGSLARRELVESDIARWPKALSGSEYVPDDDVAEGLSVIHSRQKISKDVPTGPSTGWAFNIGHQTSAEPLVPPEMPTYFTRPNCCWMSWACYEFFRDHSDENPEFWSLEWKQGICCYRKVISNENCTNPPPPPDLQPMYITPPPYCVN